MNQPITTYRLEALALHEVGVFGDVHLDFKPIASAEADARKAEIHLFTGPNGCGKSTLLYAMAGIFDGFRADSLLTARLRDERGSSVSWTFAGAPGLFALSGLHNTAPDIGKYRARTGGVTPRVGTGLEGFRPFHFAAVAYSGQRTLRDAPLGAIQEITASPFENALSFDSTVRPQILLQWIANNRAEAALAQSEGNALEAETYDRALQRIVDLIRDICDLEVEFRLQRKPLAVTLRVNGTVIPFSGLPDGLKSIISWVADLALRVEAIRWAEPRGAFEQPIILFLDEVDIHLHPKWQRRILPAIQKLLPNAQVFVSTHSPFVVGSVEDAWVYRLPEPGTAEAASPLVIEGVPASAGKSYRLILEEVFGIDDEFDVETEALFDRFYTLRTQFMAAPGDAAPLLDAARELAQRGEEVGQIVARELRQVSRVSGREVSLA